MYKLKKNGKVFMSNFVGTGPSSYEKRIYWAAVSHRLRNTGLIHKKSSFRAMDNPDVNSHVESRQFARFDFIYNSGLAYLMTSFSLKCKFVENLFKYRHTMERVSVDNQRNSDCHVNFRSEYPFTIYLTTLSVVWSV